MEVIEFNGKEYPTLQTRGNAAKFATPFFLEVCKGIGYDVGCNKTEWAFPGSIPIDPELGTWDAMNLPDGLVDYIANSHMLEHYIGRYQEVIEYWLSKIKKGGLIFMYLPNCDQQDYWAFGNKKHIHHLTPLLMNKFCSYLINSKLICKFIVTEGFDLNSSFYCIIEK